MKTISHTMYAGYYIAHIIHNICIKVTLNEEDIPIYTQHIFSFCTMQGAGGKAGGGGGVTSCYIHVYGMDGGGI